MALLVHFVIHPVILFCAFCYVSIYLFICKSLQIFVYIIIYVCIIFTCLFFLWFVSSFCSSDAIPSFVYMYIYSFLNLFIHSFRYSFLYLIFFLNYLPISFSCSEVCFPVSCGLNLFPDEALSAYLKSLELQPSVVLDPPFTPLWTEYHAPVPYDVTMVRVIATPLHCHIQTRFEHRLGPTQWVQQRATESGCSV
jgi:hypothetical protein